VPAPTVGANAKKQENMLEFILGLTSDIIMRTHSLTVKEKRLIRDEVNYAINQTRTHISNTRKGNVDKASSQLSNIWRRVGNKLQEINNRRINELANTIEQKSKYWSDPDNYSIENIRRFEMRLTQVEQTLEEIII
jgi:isocitrate dehydrogenase